MIFLVLWPKNHDYYIVGIFYTKASSLSVGLKIFLLLKYKKTEQKSLLRCGTPDQNRTDN